MSQLEANLLEFVWEAYRSEFGVKIKMANTVANRARIYRVKRKFPDLRYIHVEGMSTDPDHIYLTKRKKEDVEDGDEQAHDTPA